MDSRPACFGQPDTVPECRLCKVRVECWASQREHGVFLLPRPRPEPVRAEPKPVRFLPETQRPF